MTLGNMRENGVRSVEAECEDCGHSAVVNVDQFLDAVFVPDVGKRLRCTQCGSNHITTRPNWQERAWPVGPRI
jgi:ribosomal protein S27AE